MSQGSIEERLQQNNTELTNVITTVEELPTFIDTSDANATAADLFLNKTAYVDGEKIIGTYTPQTTYNMHLYSSEQEMENDETVQEGDMGVIYNYELVPIDNEKLFKRIVIPKTFTLESITTGTKIFHISKEDGDGSVECRIVPTQFSIGYNEYAYWKSIDAQTFTFDHISYGFDDEFLKDIYQDENNIIVEFFVAAKTKTEVGSEILEIFQQFVNIEQVEFTGLYDYKNYLSNSVNPVDVSQLTLDYENHTMGEKTYGNEVSLDFIPEMITALMTKYNYSYDFRNMNVFLNDNYSKAYIYVLIESYGVDKYLEFTNGITCFSDTQKLYVGMYSGEEPSINRYLLEYDISTKTITENVFVADKIGDGQNYMEIKQKYFVGQINAMEGQWKLDSTTYPQVIDTDGNNYGTLCNNFVSKVEWRIARSQLSDVGVSSLTKYITAYGNQGVVTGDGSYVNNITNKEFSTKWLDGNTGIVSVSSVINNGSNVNNQTIIEGINIPLDYTDEEIEEYIENGDGVIVFSKTSSETIDFSDETGLDDMAARSVILCSSEFLYNKHYYAIYVKADTTAAVGGSSNAYSNVTNPVCMLFDRTRGEIISLISVTGSFRPVDVGIDNNNRYDGKIVDCTYDFNTKSFILLGAIQHTGWQVSGNAQATARIIKIAENGSISTNDVRYAINGASVQTWGRFSNFYKDIRNKCWYAQTSSSSSGTGNYYNSFVRIMLDGTVTKLFNSTGTTTQAAFSNINGLAKLTLSNSTDWYDVSGTVVAVTPPTGFQILSLMFTEDGEYVSGYSSDGNNSNIYSTYEYNESTKEFDLIKSELNASRMVVVNNQYAFKDGNYYYDLNGNKLPIKNVDVNSYSVFSIIDEYNLQQYGTWTTMAVVTSYKNCAFNTYSYYVQRLIPATTYPTENSLYITMNGDNSTSENQTDKRHIKALSIHQYQSSTEDLSDVLTAQDEQIAELQGALYGKTAGENKPFIFVQLEEPDIKKGIWLKKDGEVKHYTYDDEVYIGGTWEMDGKYTNIPYSFYYSRAGAVVGKNIYLFGGNGRHK